MQAMSIFFLNSVLRWKNSDLYKSKENKVRINIMAFFTYNVLYESSTDRLEKLGLMLPFNNGIKIIFLNFSCRKGVSDSKKASVKL